MSGRRPVGKEAIEKKGWWLAHRWLLLRRASQLSILGLFLLGPWAGIWLIKGNLSSSLLLGSVPMTDPLLLTQMLLAGMALPLSTVFTGAAIVLIFYLLVGGRVFCSWVCPMNMVTDAASWLRERLAIHPPLALSRHARYWMLALTLLLSLVTGSLAFELVNPVSILHRGIIFGMGLGWMVVLGIFLFDLLLARRGWCGHLCPTGAFYGLVGRFSPLRVRADQRERCDDCLDCYVVCPEPQVLAPVLRNAAQGVPPVILSGDCTNCGRCIDICAEEVFAFGRRSAIPGTSPQKPVEQGRLN